MNGRQRCLVILLVGILWLTGCGGSTMPDNAHDMLSVAYSNMNSMDSYSAVSTFQLSMDYLESTKDISVISNITGVNDPVEIMMEHKTAGETNSTYDYIYQKDKDVYHTRYVMDSWTKPERLEDGQVENLRTPVLFGIYLIEIDSFEIVKKDREGTVIEGKISKGHLESALRESGALRQLALTDLPKDVEEKMPEIKVRAWIDNEEAMITKVELDMKESLQALILAIIGKDSAVSAQIKSCSMVLDQIKRNEVTPVSIPSDIKKKLQKEIS